MKHTLFSCRARVALMAILLCMADIASCKMPNIGLGDSIDTEAPTITILAPTSQYATPSFTISGVATDNRGITSVSVSYTYRKTRNGEKETETKDATITGQKSVTWNCDLSFPTDFDQDVAINVTASDQNGNSAWYSRASVSVSIDTTAPVVQSITIIRDDAGEFTESLHPITDFIAAQGWNTQIENPIYNDYFQNESVSLQVAVEELYKLGSNRMNLYEVTANADGSWNRRLVKSDIYPKDYTSRQPVFTFGLAELSADRIHYITPELLVEDAAGNAITKTYTDAAGVPAVFAWYGKYDTPKVLFPFNYDADSNRLTIAQNGIINLKLFDDDNLTSCEYVLYKGKVAGNTMTQVVLTNTLTYTNGDREQDVEIKTDGVDDGYFALKVTVKDREDAGSSQTNVTWMDVKIVNPDVPVISVDTPNYGETPAKKVNGTTYTFDLEGTVSDNQPVSDIAVAWLRLPSDAGKARQQSAISDVSSYFEQSYTFDEDKSTADWKIWNLGRTGGATASGSSWISKFKKEFNIFTDFTNADGSLNNEAKILVIAARDINDQVETEVLRISGYVSRPTVSIKLNGVEESRSAVTLAPDTEVKIEFTVGGDFPIEAFEVKEGSGNWDTKTLVNEKFTVAYEADDNTSGIERVVSYRATDKIGNVTEGDFTVSFDENPKLTAITFVQEDRELTGGTLQFKADFDKGVTVTGTPQMKFTMDEDEYTAVYKPDGSTPTTLLFEWDVLSNVEYKPSANEKNIQIIAVNENYIALNGGSIMTSAIPALFSTEELSVAPSYRVTIDTKAPDFAETSFTGQTDGKTANFTKDNGAIQIIFNFTEPVEYVSGKNITIYRKGSEDVAAGQPHTWHIPAVLDADVFEKIWNNSTPENRKILSSSDTEKSVAGKDAYGQQTIVSKGPYKMYTNGLKLNDEPIYQYKIVSNSPKKSATAAFAANTVLVPDLTTKYVLDYDYDISGSNKPGQKTWESDDEYSKKPSTSDIRLALEAVGYHKTTITVDRLVMNSDRTSATLEIRDSDFMDGIHEGVEYIMSIDGEAFVDDLQNAISAVKKEYTFTVGATAKPVIRVNRWSTNSNTALDPYHAPDKDDYAKTTVKIESETPDAKITYQITEVTVDSGYSTTANTQQNQIPPEIAPVTVGTAESSLTSQTKTAYVSAITTGNGGSSGTYTVSAVTYSKAIKAAVTAASAGKVEITVGNKGTDKAERIYIGAYAASNSSDLNQSGDVYEGAFKTVVRWNGLYKGSDPSSNLYSGAEFKVLACQTPEGVSYVAGWPLTMRQFQTGNDTSVISARDKYKLAYHTDDNTNEYYWVSWELLSDDLFTITTCTWDFQKVIDSMASYGAYIWAYRIPSWG